ncbi:hypothetical protein SAMN05216302_101840 [Nitrosomonas aestuarii]|uniref:Uncharacterized protein n=1 Tax=Nitrosomonas aestuarii TaxID=52441 RepID=A0A1I4D0A0_9PROT|nr:hypothetical protein [Nitrosomonas aestuarii]SFK87044.1 hypothetical protein SAMN05216302_101840 [Nitrosomonas aestuarii]
MSDTLLGWSCANIGSNSVNRMIDTLVPIIAKADVDIKVRKRWLDRIWTAFQDDEIPHLECLGDYWG